MTEANHGRDVAVQGDMEHQTAKLSELEERVFGCRAINRSTAVTDIELKHAPVQLPHFIMFPPTGESHF